MVVGDLGTYERTSSVTLRIPAGSFFSYIGFPMLEKRSYARIHTHTTNYNYSIPVFEYKSIAHPLEESLQFMLVRLTPWRVAMSNRVYDRSSTGSDGARGERYSRGPARPT
jgi:hypothetical protein